MKLNFPELAGIYIMKKKKNKLGQVEVLKMHTTDRVINGGFEKWQCNEEEVTLTLH